MLTGPVGSGKTELLQAFVAEAVAAGARSVGATGARFGQQVHFAVLDQLARTGRRPRLTVRRLARLLDDIRRGHVHDGNGLSAEVLHQVCLALLDCVEDLPQPVVITVDDAQFADAESLRCLYLLVRRLRTGRLLIIFAESDATACATSLSGELPSAPVLHRVDLPPLSPAAVESVLASRVGRHRAQQLAAECHALTGGNPLLVEGLAQDNDRAARDGLAHPVVGRGFRQALLGCLYRSGEAALAMAREIAILGADGSPGGLSGLGTHVARRTIASLNAAGVLCDGRFRHPEARAAVLASLPGAERAELHGRAADLLFQAGAPVTLVSRQLLAAERPPSHVLVPVLEQAAQTALADNDVQLALDCLRLASRSESGPEQQASVTALLARAEWRVDPALGQRHDRALRAAVESGVLGQEHALAHVRSLLWFGHPQDAARTLTGLQSAAGGSWTAESAARQLSFRIWLSLSYPETARPTGAAQSRGPAERGHPRQPRTGSKTRAPGSLAGSWATPARAHLYAATLLDGLLRRGPGPHLVDWALRLLQKHTFTENTLSIHLACLMTLVACDRLRDAERCCAALLPEADHSPTWQAQLAAVRAEISLRRHSLPAAVQQARQALSLVPPESWGVAVGLPLSTLVQAHTSLGQHRTAAALVGEPLPNSICQTPTGLHVLKARGRTLFAAGQPHAALDDFTLVGRLAVQWDMDVPALLPWRTDAAQVHLALGHRVRARELAEEQLSLCSEHQPRIKALTLQVLAFAARPKERPQLFQQALDVLQDYPDPDQLAHLRYDLFCAGQEGGATFDAGTSDDKTAERVLTEAESRVASLAAHGHSNREIADQLFITVSTVEQHLTRTYRKLNVRRRTQLAGAMRHAQGLEGTGSRAEPV